MGLFTEELKRLTTDPGALRLGEIADQIVARLDRIESDCCPDDNLTAAPSVPAPQAAVPTPESPK